MKLAIFFLLVSGMLLAQDLGVSGRVMDPQGKPVAGVPVHLMIHAGTGHDDVVQVTSDEQGQYHLKGLIPGTYTVRAESPDFVAATRNFTVATGQNAVADLQFLQVAQQHQSVVISASSLEPPLICVTRRCSIEPCSRATIRFCSS